MPIGISFIPSVENQQSQGPAQGNREGDLAGGGSSDLGQATKILSLRLPSVVGARPIAPPTLLNGPGSAGVADPYAAVFAALLKAISGGTALPSMGGSPSIPPPKVTFPDAIGRLGMPDSSGGASRPDQPDTQGGVY